MLLIFVFSIVNYMPMAHDKVKKLQKQYYRANYGLFSVTGKSKGTKLWNLIPENLKKN